MLHLCGSCKSSLALGQMKLARSGTWAVDDDDDGGRGYIQRRRVGRAQRSPGRSAAPWALGLVLGAHAAGTSTSTGQLASPTRSLTHHHHHLVLRCPPPQRQHCRPPPPAPPGCIFLSTCSTTLRYGTPTGLRRRSRPITISLSACCCYNDVPLGSCVRRCDAAWRPPVHIMRIFSLPRLFIFLVFPSDSPFCLLAS